MSDELILNVNPGDIDVIHRRAGLTENCNTDQIEGRQMVDPETADALIATGQARQCQYCGGHEV